MEVYFVVYILIGAVPIIINQVPKGYEKRRKYCSIICGIVIISLFALRGQSMGVDLGYGTDTGYLASFDKISKFTWKQAFTENVLNYERGYIIFNKLVSCVCNDKQFFLATCALVSVAPVVYVICKKSYNVSLSYYIYMGLPVFLMLFSGIRQSIAIGICFLAFLFIDNRKWVKFILAIVLASLFHYSSIIFLFAYPLYHIKISNCGRIFSLVLLPILYFFRYQLFTVLSKIFKDKAVPDDNGAIELLFIFIFIYVVCFIFARKEKQTNGYLNLFYGACIYQIFAGVYSTAMRVGYYFMIFAILLIPQVIKNLEFNIVVKEKISIAISMAFIVFSLYLLYTSSFAMSYPYVFFWR